MTETSYSKKISALWLTGLFILLLPLLIINSDDKLDWGDDNFQYLNQSRYIFKASDAPVITNGNDYGPPKKGLFYSLILSFNPSESIKGYKRITLAIFLLSGILVFYFLKTYIKPLVALLMTLSYAYLPFAVDLKNQLLSEFLFIVLLYSVFLIEKRKPAQWLLLTVLFVLMTHTRTVGMVFYLSFLILIAWRERNRPTFILTRICFSAAIFLSLYFIIKKILYPVPITINEEYYFNAFNYQALTENTPRYFQLFFELFEFEIPQTINLVLKIAVGLLLITGLTYIFKKGHQLFLISLPLYLFTIMSYHSETDMKRFLLPLVPYSLVLIYEGLHYLTHQASPRINEKTVSVIFFVLMISLNLQTLRFRNWNNEFAANSLSLVKDLSVIRKTVSAHDVIAFEKPFFVNYYLGCNSFAITNTEQVPKNVMVLKLKKKDDLSYHQQKDLINDTILDLANFYLLYTKDQLLRERRPATPSKISSGK